MNPTSPTPRRTLEKTCDRLWQTAIRLVWGGRCGFTGRLLGEGEGCGHHLIGRANKQTRHCLENGILLDLDSHSFADQNRGAVLAFLQKKFSKLYDWHEEHKNMKPERVSIEDLKKTRDYLKNFIKENK